MPKGYSNDWQYHSTTTNTLPIPDGLPKCGYDTWIANQDIGTYAFRTVTGLLRAP